MAETNKGQDEQARAQSGGGSNPTPSPVSRQNPAEVKRDSQHAAERAPKDGRAGGDPDNPLSGVGNAVAAAHAARVSVPGHEGVDARLDNRAGRFRPPLEQFPAKPQQIDGPDVIHQVEHTRATLDAINEADGPVKGMFSPGPHGLSDEALREGPTSFGTEGLSAEEAAGGSPRA